MTFFQELQEELTSRTVKTFYTTAMWVSVPERGVGEPPTVWFTRMESWLKSFDFSVDNFANPRNPNPRDERVEKFESYGELKQWARESFKDFTPSLDVAEYFRDQFTTKEHKPLDFPLVLKDESIGYFLNELWAEFNSQQSRFGVYTFRELKEKMKELEDLFIAEGRITAAELTTLTKDYWAVMDKPELEEQASAVTKDTFKGSKKIIAELEGRKWQPWHPKNWFS